MKTRPDWLRVTFLNEGLSTEVLPAVIDEETGEVLAESLPLTSTAQSAIEIARKALGRMEFTIDRGKGGFLGFAFWLSLRHNGVECGRLGWGGDHMRGRAAIEFNGSGCAVIGDWLGLSERLEDLPEARITRVDLALDLMDGLGGTFTARSACEWWAAGEFDVRGRRPNAKLVDDLDSGLGSTLYVGSRKGHKFLRVYHKGQQMGDAASPWVRVELEIKSVEHVIGFDVLAVPDAYFAGAYPLLSALVDEAGQTFDYITRAASVEAEKALREARRQLGPVIKFAMERLGWSAHRIVAALMREPSRQRITLSHVYAGLIDSEGLAFAQAHLPAKVDLDDFLADQGASYG